VAKPKARAKPARTVRAKSKPARKTKTGKKFIRRVTGAGSRPSRKKRNLAWRVTKGTVKGTGKLLWKGGSLAVHETNSRIKRFNTNRRFADGYTPEPGEIPKGKWVRNATTVHGRRFDSPESAMAYSAKVESQGPPVVRAERPRGTLELRQSGKHAGKVRVRPPTKRKPPTGRHRQTKSAKQTRADQLVAAYRGKLTEIGKKAVAENTTARAVQQAFLKLQETKPGKLSQIEGLATGMEQAMGTAAEAVENYRLSLIQLGFNPALLMHLVEVQENYEAAAHHWTAYVAIVKAELAWEIRMAQRRAAGEMPSDSTLAG
jgi:hypothetical protein